MDKIFRQVSVKERLPKLCQTTIFIDRLGNANQLSIDRGNEVYDRKNRNWITETDLLISYDYWFEEVQLPNIDHMKYSDPDPDKYREHSNIYDDGYADGANDGYIDGFKEAIDKLKGTDTLGKEVKGE